jgi:Rieske Fe-S protein
MASLIAVGSLIEGCASSPTAPSNSQAQLTTLNGVVGNNIITVNVPTDSALATVGGAAFVNSANGAFLVAQVSQGTINAMTAICTHEGCTINQFVNSVFHCECHGSQFSTSGTVVSGPATQPLRRFNTTFAANVLSISL